MSLIKQDNSMAKHLPELLYGLHFPLIRTGALILLSRSSELSICSITLIAAKYGMNGKYSLGRANNNTISSLQNEQSSRLLIFISIMEKAVF